MISTCGLRRSRSPPTGLPPVQYGLRSLLLLVRRVAVLTEDTADQDAELGAYILTQCPVYGDVLPDGLDQFQYELRVVSGMPKGSGCSQFNDYEICRTESNRIDVVVAHHQIADPDIVCIADYSTVETQVPLGSDFEPGAEHTVTVNSDTTTSFIAQ